MVHAANAQTRRYDEPRNSSAWWISSWRILSVPRCVTMNPAKASPVACEMRPEEIRNPWIEGVSTWRAETALIKDSTSEPLRRWTVAVHGTRGGGEDEEDMVIGRYRRIQLRGGSGDLFVGGEMEG